MAPPQGGIPDRPKFGMTFRPRTVKLLIGGTHEFDAVSDDLSIVAAIKAAGGRIPSGKVKGAEAELYYLTLVPAEVRLLVMTSPEFYRITERRLERRLAPDISLELVPLPLEMEEEVDRVRRVASKEVTPAGDWQSEK
ncbi:MAG: hypothetical protein ACUVRC_10340 [Desulfotomaculales bacterium]